MEKKNFTINAALFLIKNSVYQKIRLYFCFHHIARLADVLIVHIVEKIEF